MRLIDADAIKIPSTYVDLFENCRNCKLLDREQVREIIDNAPSIDIVRCKECKKANTEDCSHSYWDDDWGEWRVGYKGDDWFCADGEREDE